METPLKTSLESLLQRFTLPLSQADCQRAQACAAAQHDPAIAHRAQYSMLATLTARYFLRLLGIASPPPRVPGELQISPAHCVQCVPVVAGQPIMNPPKSVAPFSQSSQKQQAQRSLGTLAIEINLSQREVEILGFSPAPVPVHPPVSAPASAPASASVSVPQLTKAHRTVANRHIKGLPPLQPMTALINRLSERPHLPLVTHLQQWLTGQFEQGWQQRGQRANPLTPCFRTACFRTATSSPMSKPSETDLLEIIRHTANDEKRWVAAEQLWELNPTHPESPILRSKDLGVYLLGHHITLLVGVLAKSNQQRLILVRAEPTGANPYLPRNLGLTGIDNTGDTVFLVRSRQQDDYIQFKFTADVGDRFDLKIHWTTASVTEHFIV